MNLENVRSSLIVRQTELDFTIETTGSKQSRVKSVRSIGGHDDLSSSKGIETVHLVQKLDRAIVFHQSLPHMLYAACSLNQLTSIKVR